MFGGNDPLNLNILAHSVSV